jgi:ATP-dependent DNA helicase RecG
LSRLGITTPVELLYHFPSRWVDRREIRNLESLAEGDTRPAVDEGGDARKPVVTAMGMVAESRHFGKGKQGHRAGSHFNRLEVTIRDETGSAKLVFFGGEWRKPHFPVGATVLVSGTLSVFRGALQFMSPDYEVLSDEEEAAIHTGRLYPVYPLTRGLTQRHLRGWVRYALDRVLPMMEDALPSVFRDGQRLVSLHEALRGFHFPRSPAERSQAYRRLAFEELLFDQMFVHAVRLRREQGKVSCPIERGAIYRRVHASLPFHLTEDQNRALEEILLDLGRPRPANRLLQGDVGSGKTVVALLAAAAAADSRLQTAFMVPTEILAEQHYRTLQKLGGVFGLEPRILTGSMNGGARQEVLQALANGSAPVVVGTHALFQEAVRFQNLGLVVVDEQHRFGVVQRVAIMEKGMAPHVLVMSATPIPRSLALVRYADLDLSVLRHRPAGRGRVVTRVTGEEKREAVYSFLAERLREGRQAYVIYPLVEESTKSGLKAATTMARRLGAHPEFSEFEVGLLHGQMRSEEKDAVMKRFVAGEVQILVATTVIEVGIDVANASFLVIEHPERYGLSQLHQLRGRIGRGEHTSYCVLISGKELDEIAVRRLELFRETADGFKLAGLDLSLRGQGDMAGTRQSGRPAFRVADPMRDPEMTDMARSEARCLLDEGKLTPDGGAEWEPMRRRLRSLLEAAGDLTDAG